MDPLLHINIDDKKLWCQQFFLPINSSKWTLKRLQGIQNRTQTHGSKQLHVLRDFSPPNRRIPKHVSFVSLFFTSELGLKRQVKLGKRTVLKIRVGFNAALFLYHPHDTFLQLMGLISHFLVGGNEKEKGCAG